ncbi:hypothetical protein [Psychrobacillus glaciei]|uniref:hypothetical protein n=1 Tax=Psychrobacillus glaciei TaxID=2283160 RepID=UPI001CEF954D|nr:hypothetical protein [Psychrobacillus glaciei]
MERLPQMKEGRRHEEFPDFEGFNTKAAAQAQELTFKETLRYAKQQRHAIIEQLLEIEEVEWDKVFFIGEHQLSIRNYFTDFIDHDNYHIKQISNN